VHRLDRGTSGCLLVAKTTPWHARLMTQFFLRRVEKSYIALVYTHDTTIPNEGQIDLPIDGRPAQSSFVVLERYGKLAAKLRVRTYQGRKHQVRIHCSRGLQAPIFLDPLYGGEAIMYHLSDDSSCKECRARQQFCHHADALSMPDLDIHDIQAPLPDWWTPILEDILRW
jgi:23S rRNA-/tRNA-specific pseudouridylate synthase